MNGLLFLRLQVEQHTIRTAGTASRHRTSGVRHGPLSNLVSTCTVPAGKPML
ncbi:hypothetical protein M3J09_001796 [Ascochyta lentis]